MSKRSMFELFEVKRAWLVEVNRRIAGTASPPWLFRDDEIAIAH